MNRRSFFQSLAALTAAVPFLSAVKPFKSMPAERHVVYYGHGLPSGQPAGTLCWNSKDNVVYRFSGQDWERFA